MALLESIATQGFSGLLSNLATSYLTNKINIFSNNKDEISTDISENISVAYEKCISIKTILSDEMVPFLEIYSDQNFSSDGLSLDQYDLVDRVRKGRSIVIIGTGGGGKSMFMRYLWLAYFEDPRGKIPFFLELRQLNRLTHDSIEDFIFHSIIKSGSKISQSSFTKSLHSGHFIIFLDGFDEINHDKREAIEERIIALKSNHPKLTVVVTSRPDDRFKGWHQFNIVSVEPLDKKKSIKLIERAPFDKSKISKIVNKINEGLYESHQSFLSNPLLAYMLLLTFSHNPKIPSKMFLFYEQAFEALYHRHDLTKGGYTRKFYLNVDKQNFIRQLSYFCLISYYDEVFEFRDENLRHYVDRAKKMESANYDIIDFINDMMESICLIKREGLDYSFTHRSFQEYFSAYCIARVANRRVEDIFEKFSRRYNDQVLGMVYDINKDLFREKYTIPMKVKFKSFYRLSRERSIISKFFFEKNGIFRFLYREDGLPPTLRQGRATRRVQRVYWPIHFDTHGVFDSFDRNIQRIANDYLPGPSLDTLDNKMERDDKFIKTLFDTFSVKSDVFEVKSDGVNFRLYRNGEFLPDAVDQFGWYSTYMYDFVRHQALRNHRFVNLEQEEYDKVSTSFEELMN